MRKIIVLLCLFLLIKENKAQSVQLIPNPDTTAVGFDGYSVIEYNGALYATYLNNHGKRQLAKYVNNTINLIPNPDTSGSIVENSFYVFSNNLFFAYLTDSAFSNTQYNFINRQFAKFDGNTISLIANPSNAYCIGDMYSVASRVPFYFETNSQFYCGFFDTTSGYENYLVGRYNGLGFDKINCPAKYYPDYYHKFAYNNKLCFIGLYDNNTTSNYLSVIYTFDGNNFNISDTVSAKNLNLTPISSSYFLNNKHYFEAYKTNNAPWDARGGILEYDGVKLKEVYLDTGQYTQFYNNTSIVYNNKLYIFRHYNNYPNYYTHDILEFDGTNTKVIFKSDKSSSYYIDKPFGFEISENKLYCPVYSANGKRYLSQFDGTNFRILPNNDTAALGVGGIFKANNKLYCGYLDSDNKLYIARYNDTTFVLYNKPDSLGYFGNWYKGYNNNLYITYVNDKGKYQIAYLNEPGATDSCFPAVTITSTSSSICYGTKVTFTAKVAAITTKVALPTSGKLFIIGTAVPGGWNNPAPVPTQEFARKDISTFIGVFNLIANGNYLLIPDNGSWASTYRLDNTKANNYSTGSFVNGANGGIDFIAPPSSGKYLIEINFYTGKYSVTPYTQTLPLNLYITGSATYAGWNNPVPVPSQQFTRLNSCVYQITLPLTANQWYLWLPVNGSWATKFAILNNTLSGVEKNGSFQYYSSGGGDNFISPTTSGNYRIKADFSNYKYEVINDSVPQNQFAINYSFQWFKNGMPVGSNTSNYTDSLLNQGDAVWCVVKGNTVCSIIDSAKSNILLATVNPNISGNIIYIKNNAAIKNVKTIINALIKDSTTTNGKYSFNCLSSNNTYIIRPTKNNDIAKANGVTSVDALLVQRHILNTTKLNNAYKLIAADVDGNKAINSVDILRMKRLILGTDTTFKNTTTSENRLWAFVDSAYQFPDTTNPFPFKDSISFTNLTSNKINQTFIGVKLGDVNFDWNSAVAKPSAVNCLPSTANSQSLTENCVQLVVTNKAIQSPSFGGVGEAAFSTLNSATLSALQTTIHFDNTKYEFISIGNNKYNIDFNTTQANTTGNISLVWIDKQGETKTFKAGEELFSLVLKPKAINNLQFTINDLQLNDDITTTAAFDEALNRKGIVLIEKSTDNSPLSTANGQLWTIYPNPAHSQFTVVGKSMTDKGQIIITNMLGKQVAAQTLSMGNNTIDIANLAKGMYFVSVITNEGKQTKKLVVE